jgi:excisionase family DNA binding protein
MDKNYTTAEAAVELGVTPARVRQMVLDGLLEAEKFGRDLVISAKALTAAKHRKTKPGPAPKQNQTNGTGRKKGSRK